MIIRMSSIAAILLLSASSGHAADNPAQYCRSIDDVKKSNPGFSFRPLNMAEFHFAQGIYYESPATPPGLPPGNGAVLVAKHGTPSRIFWTMGKLVCNPIVITDEFVKTMETLKEGPGEAL